MLILQFGAAWGENIVCHILQRSQRARSLFDGTTGDSLRQQKGLYVTEGLHGVLQDDAHI